VCRYVERNLKRGYTTEQLNVGRTWKYRMKVHLSSSGVDLMRTDFSRARLAILGPCLGARSSQANAGGLLILDILFAHVVYTLGQTRVQGNRLCDFSQVQISQAENRRQKPASCRRYRPRPRSVSFWSMSHWLPVPASRDFI
jgi:hypothetical protein